MTIAVSNTSNTNTFDYWRNRTNEIAHALSTYVVTTDSNNTTGNAFVNGVFSATTIAANGMIRGGNVTVTTVLTVGSNVFVTDPSVVGVGNTTANAVTNTTHFVVSTATRSGYITVTDVYSGNSTDHFSGNSTLVRVGNTVSYFIANSTLVQTGNSTSNFTGNSTIVSVGDTTTNFSGNSTVIQVGNTTTNCQIVPTSVVGEHSNTQTTGTSAQLIDSFSLNISRAADYMITVKDNGANAFQISKISLIHDDTDTYTSEYGIVYTNTQIATFSANANSTHARVYVTPTPVNTQVKVVRLRVAV